MGLVDNKDAVARLGGLEYGPLPQLAHLIDAVIRRRIQLNYIQIARPARRQRPTRGADPTRCRSGPLLTVETAGQNPRRGGLTAATRTRKQVGVIDPVGFSLLIAGIECCRQRLCDMPLPHHFSKGRWTILPIQSHVPSLPSRPEPAIRRQPAQSHANPHPHRPGVAAGPQTPAPAPPPTRNR